MRVRVLNMQAGGQGMCDMCDMCEMYANVPVSVDPLVMPSWSSSGVAHGYLRCSTNKA